MVLFEIHQKLKGNFLKKLRVSFKALLNINYFLQDFD